MTDSEPKTPKGSEKLDSGQTDSTAEGYKDEKICLNTGSDKDGMIRKPDEPLPLR